MRKFPLPLIALLFCSTVFVSVHAQQTRVPAREAEWKNYALPKTNFTRKRDIDKTVILRVPADWQQENESFTFKGPHDAVLKLFVQKSPEGYPLDDYFAATLQAVRDRAAGEYSVVTRRTQFQNIEAREMVMEATNPEGEEYGRDRLVSAVRACRTRPARDMIDYIYNEIFEWSGGHGAGDDVTFVIIKAL